MKPWWERVIFYRWVEADRVVPYIPKYFLTLSHLWLFPLTGPKAANQNHQNFFPKLPAT